MNTFLYKEENHNLPKYTLTESLLTKGVQQTALGYGR